MVIRSPAGPTPEATDVRPRTVVLHQFLGIGDLVWHVPYFRAVAQQSHQGQVAVIASPSTHARALLSGEACVSEVIDFERHARSPDRRGRKRPGRHGGLLGLFRMGWDLRGRGFERIVIYSLSANRGLVAKVAGIPERLGYGTSWLKRCFLTRGPYIQAYKGESVAVYKNATAFSVAQGFCAGPIVPKLQLDPQAIESVRPLLADLPRPLYAFAIGSSEPFKQWGARNFTELAQALVMRGCGVLLLGGPVEDGLAQAILSAVAPAQRAGIRVFTHNSVLQSAAMLAVAQACIGNDTGMTNLAAALDRPSFVLLGQRPLLDHDPLMHLLRDKPLASICANDVLEALGAHGAPGF